MIGLYWKIFKTKWKFKMWKFRIKWSSKLVTSSLKSVGKETKKTVKYGKNIVEEVKSLFPNKKK